MEGTRDNAVQKIFGKNVKTARQAKGLTQMELAVKTNTDSRQIQRIEAGEIATSITQAYLVAHVLEVSMDTLFEGME